MPQMTDIARNSTQPRRLTATFCPPPPRPGLCSPANNRWDRAVDGEGRFAALVETLSGEPGVTPPDGSRGRRFGSFALTVSGSIFAMLSGGDVVLKLRAARVTALVADGRCAPFDAGKG